jgi:hypothetical protein
VRRRRHWLRRLPERLLNRSVLQERLLSDVKLRRRNV